MEDKEIKNYGQDGHAAAANSCNTCMSTDNATSLSAYNGSCWERTMFEVVPGHEVPLSGTKEI